MQRQTFWKLKDMTEADLTSAVLCVSGSGTDCPADLRRLGLRWRSDNEDQVAIVPEFSERLEAFLPTWLLQAVGSGNIRLVFEVNGDHPEIDVTVAVSTIHFFTRLPVSASHSTIRMS